MIVDTLTPPKWYAEMRLPTRLPTRGIPHQRSKLLSIVRLRDYIMDLDGNGNLLGGSTKTHYQAIRDQLHKLDFYDVNEYLLKKSKILDSHNGLSSIFWNENDYPWDIKLDARQLYNKWVSKDFSGDIYKGATRHRLRNNAYNRDRQVPDKAKENRDKADFHGEGKFVNGQWWPNQSCAQRDGVHGNYQGGIYGTSDRGAFSVVLSGTSYPDKDNGSSIWYYGTAGNKDFCKAATGATDYLLTSMSFPAALKKPVRVLRSHTLRKSNPYRPARGIRYDGLYEVMDKQCVDEVRHVYCFLLERCPGQDPIRYKGVEARPTSYEIDAFDMGH